MMYWIVFFFIFAALSRLLIRLPPTLYKIIFVTPYIGVLGESIKPFVEQSWPFPRDGLSDFFACLIAGVGACVAIYASSYFSETQSKKFFPLLFTFTGAMLGVVWVDNIFAFYTFWELTGICSFLLIGFDHSAAEARRGAKRALLVTMAGGLFLLAAILILVHETGSTSIMDILYGKINSSDYKGPLFFCLAIAAMTKSAQFPFHAWLPGAMSAPIPASCYLHSATMVKLGVFLLARFSPLFYTQDQWIVTLSVVGGITLLWGLVISLTRSDLKELLAWTTVSSLGGMFILIGLNVGYSWKAFFAYVFAHSCYKASLFLCAGSIDKKMGTRNLDKLSDLYRHMPMTCLSILLALGSMIGFPFSLGFLAKEYLLKSALAQGGMWSLLVVVLVCSSALSIVVAYRLILPMFKAPDSPAQVPRSEAPFLMYFPALVLASIGWLSGLFLDSINIYLLSPVVSSIVLQKVDATLEMWTGMNPALVLSLISIALGVFLSIIVLRYIVKMNLKEKWEHVVPSHFNLVLKFSQWITRFLQNGKLSHYLIWLFLPLFTLTIYFYEPSFFDLSPARGTNLFFQTIPLLMITLGSLAIIFGRYSLTQVMGLAIVGLGVSFLFYIYGAIDVSMTQIAVETMSLFIFIYCLRLIKPNLNTLSISYQITRILFSLLSFFVVLILCEALASGKVDSRLADYFLENSPTLGRGQNAVNVILVDFRALDTLGEITVLAILAIGVHLLLIRKRHLDLVLKESTLLTAASFYILPLMMLFSFYIFIRGHNAPGGGFIAGLILSVSLAIYCLTFGEERTKKLLYFKPESWVIIGVLTALGSGSISFLFEDRAPMSVIWFSQSIHWLGSALFFDLGIYFLVLGVFSSLLFSLRRRGL